MKEFDLPIQKKIKALKKAREDWAILITFNEVVEELMNTDALIEKLPEGFVKEQKKEAQQEAWEILLSEEFCSRILVRE